MDVFTNTKKIKKLIIVLVLITLFNFCCPRTIKAGDGGDIDERIVVIVESLFFWIFDGIQGIVDSFFLDDSHENIETVSAEAIIKGKFILMSPNIFEKITSNAKDYYDYDEVVSERNSLRDTISGWYYALRNLAIVALLSILVYVAIRMILTTVSQDKAKYKVMFKDWLVALCLLFAMHYIMVGILNLSSMITDAIGTSGSSYTTDLRDDIQQKIDGANELLEGSSEDGIMDSMKEALSQTVIYSAMVIMNVIFVVKYVIRALTIIFLVLLAPITCITYPIDKISDGKAQAYDMWFKEFLYQVIIQPFHLLIYVVLIGSAAQLAEDNLIYAMLCFGVMIPAEKFIKQMFGFKDKLGSPLGSFATGAAASQLLSKAFSGGSKGGSKEKDSGDNSSTQNSLPPKTVDKGSLMGGSIDQDPDDNSGGSQGAVDTSDQRSIGSGQNNVVDDDGMGNADYDAYMNASENSQGSDTMVDDDGMGNADMDAYMAASQNNQALDAPSEDDNIDNTNINDSTPEEYEESPYDTEEQQEAEQTRREKAKEFGKKALAIHEQRMTKKWGSANRGKRWVNRGGKLVKTVGRTGVKVGKTALKSAAVLGGAAALGAYGAMFGQGKEGLAAGAALGGYVSQKTITGVSKAYGKASEAAGDYRNGLVSDKTREKDAFKEFSADKKQIDKAVYSYRKNHDGENPNGKQLEQELKDRFELSRYGLTDDQIDDSLELYQDRNAEVLENEALDQGIDIDQLKDKAGGEDNLDRDKYRQLLQQSLKKNDKKNAEQAIEKANRVAGSQAKYTAQLAKAYSAKDFRDPKAMENAYNQITSGLMDGLPDTEANRQMADSYARRYLTDAGAMHSVSSVPLPKDNGNVGKRVSLPEENNNVDVQMPKYERKPNLMNSLKLNNTNLTEEQQQRIQNLNIRIHGAGYDDTQISQLATIAIDDKFVPDKTITNFENIVNASIEYIEDGSIRTEAEKTVRSVNEGKAPKKLVDSEMRDRFVLKSTFNVEKEKDVTAIRDLETERIESKTQLEMTRDFANKTRGSSEAHKAYEKKQLRKKLETSGASREKIEKDLENIVDLADIMNNANKIDSIQKGTTRGKARGATKGTRRTSTTTQNNI